ncbi:MFS transporter [bacterium]|nr:MFS transporter [bacterium]
MKFITRTIWILSLVSLFTDFASEMLYPVMPMYLQSIGFSAIWIGVLEGMAEATAGLSKGYFGKLSDTIGKRVPFVQLGYSLSAISKPMMAAFINPLWVLFARTTDRLGKGIRTGARDAILSDETTPEHKGKVFGFHRAFDTMGAVLGPLTALLFLQFYPESYRTLFFIAFIPGVCAIVLTVLIKEKNTQPKAVVTNSFFSFLHYWKESPPAYRQLLFGLLTFALINSSDIFLLLMIKHRGFDDTHVISIYIFYNLVYALASYPMGILGDRIGFRKTFMFGLLLFAVVYAGIAFNKELIVFYFLFFLYGLYAAGTEGITKAWISNICEKKDTATAIGTYAAFNSIFTMLASSLAGLIWYFVAPSATFLVTAIGTILLVVYFIRMRISNK